MLEIIEVGSKITKIEVIGLNDSCFIRIWNSNGHFYDLTASYIGWHSQSLHIKDGWLIIPLGDGYIQLSKTDIYTPNLNEEARNVSLPYKIVIDGQCSVNVNVNQDGVAYSTVRYTRLDPDKAQYWVLGLAGCEVKGYISVIAKLA